MTDDSPTLDARSGPRPLERRSVEDGDSGGWMVVPTDATERERRTNWIAADEATFVDLESVR